MKTRGNTRTDRQFTTRTFAEITEAVLLAKPKTIFALPENSSIDDVKRLVADLPDQDDPVIVVVGDTVVSDVAEVNQLNLEQFNQIENKMEMVSNELQAALIQHCQLWN